MGAVHSRAGGRSSGRTATRLVMSVFVLALVGGTLTGCNERIGSRCSGSARSTSGIYNIKCVSGRWRIVSRIATPPPVTAPPPSFTLTGTGSSVQRISLSPGVKYVMFASYQATSSYESFDVISYTSSLERNRGLIYSYRGNYDGVVPVNIRDSDVGALGIEATGNWRLDIRPLTGSVPAGPGPFYGNGPSVVEYKGPTRVFVFSHSGDRWFEVEAHTLAGTDYVLSELGSYTGVRVLPGNSLVVIDANGPWMIG